MKKLKKVKEKAEFIKKFQIQDKIAKDTVSLENLGNRRELSIRQILYND